MNPDSQWLAIETERRSLADLLDTLSAEQWESRSLCVEWRVRDVAAHVAMTPRAPTLSTTITGMVRARGDLWAFGRDVAIAHAQRPTDQIVEELRRDAARRTKPAFTSVQNLLMDALVHGQDIAVPLGLHRPMPRDAAVAGFERVWSMGWPFHAQKRLRGLRLVAVDADIAVGRGEVVKGSISALLLLATERTAAALDRLEGPGVDLLRSTPPRPGSPGERPLSR